MNFFSPTNEAEATVEQVGTAMCVHWVCPRCLHKQWAIVEIDELLLEPAIECKNTAVCGEGLVFFYVKFAFVEGLYTHASQRPLEVV